MCNVIASNNYNDMFDNSLKNNHISTLLYKCVECFDTMSDGLDSAYLFSADNCLISEKL